MDLPGLNKTLAPGMSQVIEAGEHYVLKDDNEKELELVGRLDRPTIEFLKAFDVWLALEARTGPQSNVTVAARAGMVDKWNGLSNHAREAIK